LIQPIDTDGQSIESIQAVDSAQYWLRANVVNVIKMLVPRNPGHNASTETEQGVSTKLAASSRQASSTVLQGRAGATE
jgi:hypothetical protein